MVKISFRLKVILMLTLFIVATVYFSFQVLNTALTNQIRENTVENMNEMLSLLKESYLYQPSADNEKMVYPVLKSLSRSKTVENSSLLDAEGRVRFTANDSLLATGALLKVDSTAVKEVLSFSEKNGSSGRVIMPIKNREGCYKCHNPRQAVVGFVVLDLNLHQLADNVALVDNYGRLLTFLLLVIIFLLMSFLHFRFVKKSLKSFNKTIREVEKGNLDIRVAVPRSDELGSLAEGFNNMLDKVQEMQARISQLHQKELQNAQKLATVGEMAASVAHEIKNPLTGISSAMEIIVEEMNDTSKKPILQEIHRQVRRVNNTLNALLQYARPEDLEIERTDINKVIEESVFFLESQAGNNRITFKKELSGVDILFDFDPRQIEAVIINLLQNAVQSIENEGVVTIKTEFDEARQSFKLTIKDTGSGISPENLKKIFKPFYSTKAKGTGLGLAISKDIIERHGGSVSVSSVKGKGTVFEIYLPGKNISVHEEKQYSWNMKHARP